ncbi:MAG TPA: TolC family outer membrane protein [Methylomirabilota bacterium]|nr:TolC family outer membrane protein [Methylomirabilota bacterium]
MVKAGASLAAGLACGLMALLAVPPAQAQTLEDALVAAYTGNPTLQAERAKLRQTDELVPQAKAGWKPTVAVESGAGVAWIRRTFHDHLRTPITGVGISDTSEHTNNPVSASINLSQPVYRGGSTAAELRQADNTVLAERAQLAVVEEQILLQAITAYVDVVRDVAVVDLTKNNQQVIGQQLKATKERFDVGEVTKTDVSQAQARLAGAVADVVQAQGNLTASRATYKQVIGDMPGKLTRPPVPTNLPAGSDETVALSENNPAILAAIFLEKAARDGTDVVFGELLPHVSVVGSVGIDNDVQGNNVTQKDASIEAQVVIPLYQAGGVESRVREQKQLVGQRRSELDQARRTAIQDATTSWEALDTARAQIESFTAQVASNKVALDGVIQEQQVGLRTVLDVLDAQQEVLTSEVSLVTAQRDEVVAAYSVQAAIGRLTSIDLSLPVQPYDVHQHYNEVKDKWFGLNASGQPSGQ